MLKLTYTEFGLHLERVTTSLESLVCQRLVLALRLGESLHVEPSRAAFLLSVSALRNSEGTEVAGFEQLVKLVRMQGKGMLSIAPVDEGFVEVSMQGNWIANSSEAHEGMFVTVLSDRAEFFVEKLWQATQAQISAGCRAW